MAGCGDTEGTSNSKTSTRKNTIESDFLKRYIAPICQAKEEDRLKPHCRELRWCGKTATKIDDFAFISPDRCWLRLAVLF
jgi:hypothetical protein